MAKPDDPWSEQLEPVIRYLNTAVAIPRDPLATDAGCRFWLSDRGHAAAAVTPYRELLVDVRTALRASATAGPDQRRDQGVPGLRTLAASCQAGLEFEVGSRGLTWALAAPPGARQYLAEVLTVVAYASVTGAWQRVRICPGDGCGLAFVDTTRAAGRTWCSMARCGNRAKQARWRARSPGTRTA